MPHNKNRLGSIFLIPIPLIIGQSNSLPEVVKEKALEIKYYFVENIRTSRRFLKSLDATVDIDAISFSEINKYNHVDLTQLKQWLKKGFDIGVMSEAGCPGVADPGSLLVAKAQEWQVKVIPMVGPNSILLALMASGFNGQGFRFIGYLPIKETERGKAIKSLEILSSQRIETQICIETPYRNDQLFKDIIKHCKTTTKLCIAINLTAADEFIATKTISEWKLNAPVFQKRPAVFLIMA